MENPINYETFLPLVEKGLKKILPSAVHDTILVEHYNSAFIRIQWAASNYKINGVRGQYPLVASLNIYKADGTLGSSAFGGNGGRRLYFRILPEDNSHYALHGVNIPFRKPRKNEKAMMKAILKFADNWVKIVKANKDRLPHEDSVNYTWV